MFILYGRRSYFICVARNKKNERSTKENPPPSHPSTARATAAIPAADEETTKPSGRNKRYRGDRQTTVKCGVFKASRLLDTCDQRPEAASPTSSTPRVRVSSSNVTCVVCACASRLCSHMGGESQLLYQGPTTVN